MQTSVVCVRRRALLTEYANTIRDYAYLVRQLSERACHPNRIEYLKLHEEAIAARIQTEQARVQYEMHLTEHRCLHDGDQKTKLDGSA